MGWMLFGLFICLLCTIGTTTDGQSGDFMKAIMTVSICCLIGWIWYLK